jgi:hypothetical protein
MVLYMSCIVPAIYHFQIAARSRDRINVGDLAYPSMGVCPCLPPVSGQRGRAAMDNGH